MCSTAIKKGFFVFLLWILFSLCCFAAPFFVLGFYFYPKRSYFRILSHAADRLVAALLGFSGRHLLSTECASSHRYRWLYDMLNSVEPNHCENEAFDEGPYCRIADRQLGEK